MKNLHLLLAQPQNRPFPFLLFPASARCWRPSSLLPFLPFLPSSRAGLLALARCSLPAHAPHADRRHHVAQLVSWPALRSPQRPAPRLTRALARRQPTRYASRTRHFSLSLQAGPHVSAPPSLPFSFAFFPFLLPSMAHAQNGQTRQAAAAFAHARQVPKSPRSVSLPSTALARL